MNGDHLVNECPVVMVSCDGNPSMVPGSFLFSCFCFFVGCVVCENKMCQGSAETLSLSHTQRV